MALSLRLILTRASDERFQTRSQARWAPFRAVLATNKKSVALLNEFGIISVFSEDKEARGTQLNADLTKKALEKVGNPNVLVNLVSRRVRQLNGLSGGAPARPLIAETAGLGAADIALLEIADGKLGWEYLAEEAQEQQQPAPRKRKAA